jgi:thymidylate synthase ThyX
MTTISAKVIRHSKHPLPDAPDLVTIQVRYPRLIHSELMTHRVMSRNASSSRAIPTMRLLRDVIRDPAAPVEWGSNRPGMQAGDALTGWRLYLVQFAWFSAMWFALAFAWLAAKAGAHKQIVNRIIEPWSHISVIITATEWQNFFDLRCHPAADPTIRVLAEVIREAIESSHAAQMYEWEWHLPYTDERRGETIPQDLSAARCARVSYLTHEGREPSPLKDLELARQLAAARHMSPFEHQAKPLMDGSGRSNLGPHWMQYRSVVV